MWSCFSFNYLVKSFISADLYWAVTVALGHFRDGTVYHKKPVGNPLTEKVFMCVLSSRVDVFS